MSGTLLRITPRIWAAVVEGLEDARLPARLRTDLTLLQRQVREQLRGAVAVGADARAPIPAVAADFDDLTCGIDFEDLTSLARFLRSRAPSQEAATNASAAATAATADIGRSAYWLHELVRGSGLFFEKAKPREKSPELVRRLEALRVQQAKIEYENMTMDVDTTSGADNKFSIKGQITEAKESSRHVTAAFNILLSVVAVFTACMYFGRSLFEDLPLRAVFALLASLVVAFAESWLYMSSVSRSQKARSQGEDHEMHKLLSRDELRSRIEKFDIRAEFKTEDGFNDIS